MTADNPASVPDDEDPLYRALTPVRRVLQDAIDEVVGVVNGKRVVVCEPYLTENLFGTTVTISFDCIQGAPTTSTSEDTP